DVLETNEGDAQRAAGRDEGVESARFPERPTRGTTARTDLPDAGASGRPKNSAEPMIRSIRIHSDRERKKRPAVPPVRQKNEKGLAGRPDEKVKVNQYRRRPRSRRSRSRPPP